MFKNVIRYNTKDFSYIKENIVKKSISKFVYNDTSYNYFADYIHYIRTLLFSYKENKHIFMHLRSMMNQDRYSNLSIHHIEKYIGIQINNSLKIFIDKNKTKIKVFVKNIFYSCKSKYKGIGEGAKLTQVTFQVISYALTQCCSPSLPSGRFNIK